MLSCLTLFRIERKQHPEYWIDTIIKQLAHTSAVLSWGYGALGKF